MIRRAAWVLFTIVGTLPASAQTPADAPVEFLPRSVFHMGAEHLSGDDPRFIWDANLGGEVDLIDFGRGRVTFFGNYQVILGNEFKEFDPNQASYILEGSVSARVPEVEVAAVFYHQSRHLGDRDNTQAVEWNMVGVRARRSWIAGATHVDARADVRGVIQRTFVDYRWEFDGRVRADHVLRPGTGVLLAGAVRHLGVDGSQNRGGQTGIRGEAGVRFDGGGGAVELFIAGERRIDPYALQFSTKTWFTAGFRLLSR